MSKKQLLVASVGLLLIGFLTGLFGVLTIEKQRTQGHFYFGSLGGNAHVYLGAYDIGTSPIENYTLPPGWYEMKIETDFYTTTMPVRLTAGTATVVDWQVTDTLAKSSGLIYELLPLAGPETQLEIASIPDQTLVVIDEDQTSNNFTPWHTANLAPGKHTVTLTLPGYQSLSKPFTLTQSYRLKLTARLAQDQ